MRLIVALVGALAIGTLGAGCGGSGGGGSATDTTGGSEAQGSGSPALTKPEFIAQGDEICTKTNKKLEESVEAVAAEQGLSSGSSPSAEQEEEVVGKGILPVMQAEAEELGELGPPAGEEAQVEEIVKGIEEVVAEGEADPSSVTGAANPFEDVASKAKAFGLEVCGEI